MADFDPHVTIISEYANSPTLVQMIDSLHQQITADGNFQQFYDYIWNIETAQGFGLDILGRIINLPRQLIVPAIYPFGVTDGPFSMTDNQYRIALKIKALANISNSSVFDINNELQLLADTRGNAFARKLSNMFIQYVFHYAPEPYEYALIIGDGMLTRPAGVGFDIAYTINPYFGFHEAQSWDTFDQAVFAAY